MKAYRFHPQQILRIFIKHARHPDVEFMGVLVDDGGAGLTCWFHDVIAASLKKRATD